MLSATFHDRGSGADDPDFSVHLTRSMATLHTPEILYIICRNCYSSHSQGDPDFSFPHLHDGNSSMGPIATPPDLHLLYLSKTPHLHHHLRYNPQQAIFCILQMFQHLQHIFHISTLHRCSLMLHSLTLTLLQPAGSATTGVNLGPPNTCLHISIRCT